MNKAFKNADAEALRRYKDLYFLMKRNKLMAANPSVWNDPEFCEY